MIAELELTDIKIKVILMHVCMCASQWSLWCGRSDALSMITHSGQTCFNLINESRTNLAKLCL